MRVVSFQTCRVGLCTNFLGNVKADNYKELVKNFLKSYQHMGCNMSLKFHILHSHLDFFPPTVIWAQCGERFHQDIAVMNKRYAGKSVQKMLADYCWNLKEDVFGRSYYKDFLKPLMKSIAIHFLVVFFC